MGVWVWGCGRIDVQERGSREFGREEVWQSLISRYWRLGAQAPIHSSHFSSSSMVAHFHTPYSHTPYITSLSFRAAR